jgi:hypothetical protein
MNYSVQPCGEALSGGLMFHQDQAQGWKWEGQMDPPRLDLQCSFTVLINGIMFFLSGLLSCK